MYDIILQPFKKWWCPLDGWWNIFKMIPQAQNEKVLDLPAMCVIQAVGGTMAGGLCLTRQFPPQTGKRDMPSLRSVIRYWWGQTLKNSSGTPHQSTFHFENKGVGQEAHHHLELPKWSRGQDLSTDKKTSIGTHSPENMPWNKSKSHSCYRLGLLFSFQKNPQLLSWCGVPLH